MANRVNVLLTFVRHRHTSKHWAKDAAKYGYITYYKRHPDHVDPPITPSKVLMIRRTSSFKGNPWWEKGILTKLKLEETRGPIFVKNTPEVCRMIWNIKHLVEIFPVKTPDQLTKFDESTEYHVDEYGNVHVAGRVNADREKATEDFQSSVKRLEYENMSEKLRLQWLKGTAI
ncbi:mitochondrial ribosomal protein L30 [Nomia melanderi]|uniref:mitochondrial ribosomal protein L30 n=1 Tax=Nomia melanderi TaxID=2448451 RepID=UPI0013045D53|nr:39S ribosomal protein L30, mitochondrial [Nomia melanderi]XP_031844249.1 39S ribosomal protein L30, mitochondrial [Nomia melanderi]XP_031844250.1 39S ribosomal protein L30, mitochondrial [Nomia melanderi]